jgi:hypothetical protein
MVETGLRLLSGFRRFWTSISTPLVIDHEKSSIQGQIAPVPGNLDADRLCHS